MTLSGHLEMGIIAADEMSAIASIIIDRLRLKISQDTLIKCIKITIYLHDWGKLSHPFQEMLKQHSDPDLLKKMGINSAKEGSSQPMRHELVSCLLATHPPVSKWLDLNESLFTLVLIAIAGHHRKIDSLIFFKHNVSGFFEIERKRFNPIFDLGIKYFGFSQKYPNLPSKISAQEATDVLRNLEKRFEWIGQKCIEKPEYTKIIQVVRTLVMACDLAASAILEGNRTGRSKSKSYQDWINESLSTVMKPESYSKIIASAIGSDRKLRDFQSDFLELNSRIKVVVAGTGLGKSLLGFLDGEKASLRGDRSKLFILFPTTAVASSQWENYANNSEIESVLSHSRAKIDRTLAGISEQFDEESNADLTPQKKLDRLAIQVEVLKIWASPLIYATAHSVLGLMQNSLKGLASSPAIYSGRFVFDEVHSFSPALFKSMLDFMKLMPGAEFLLLTASLPESRLNAIQEAIGDEKFDILRGSKEIESLKRYRFELKEIESIWEKVITEIENNGKILWYCNTVLDSQILYTEAKLRFNQLGIDTEFICYNSRFKYGDSRRNRLHLERAFKSGDRPIIAFCTQIAEQSLDLSASFMISAVCPLWSFIQRLGRLNRFIEQDSSGVWRLRSGKARDAIAYIPAHLSPYDRCESDRIGVKSTIEFIRNSEGQLISQSDLSEALAKLDVREDLNHPSTLLHPYETKIGELVPGSNSVSCLLEEDYEKILMADGDWKKQQRIAELSRVNLRISAAMNKWKKHRFDFIAPRSHWSYNPEVGAYSTKQKELMIYG